MKCKICGFSSNSFGDALILHKHRVCFFRCEKCDFIQTQDPFWLDESYSSIITKSDIGLVERNLTFAEKTRSLIVTCLDPNQSFVDYGGGYGLFTRLMRDKGFDFYHYDPFCHNLFATGFEAKNKNKYSLATAWEVFEHVENPMKAIEDLLKFSHTIYFSTILIPDKPRPLNEWWYYGLEHGQHISFYSLKTIKLICEIFNLSLLYSDGNLHLISDEKINPLRLRICMDKKFSFIRELIKKPQSDSLLRSDFLIITGKILD